MLERIARQGTPDQQATAERTIDVSRRMRAMRTVAAEAPSAPQAAAAAAKQRIVYSADNGSSLPGRVVRSEGAPPTGDVAVNEAYDGSGATYDLYQQVYGRNSLNDRGLPLISTVHYQQQYDNAFWNGQQMVYGDGDESLPEAERLFNRFTISIDVIGHELTHGVTQYTANLNYAGQSGALNESFSDVFGVLVKQRSLNQSADQADWLIGAGLLSKNVNGQALRSMKAPGTAYNDPVLGKDPQPAHMRDYVNTTADDGGVHINSGIPNHAFYVTAVNMGGYAWEKAGRIWYVTLRDKLFAAATFQDAANLTVLIAGNLYGSGSLEQKAVQSGWAEVGITVEISTGGNGTGTDGTDTSGNKGCIPTAIDVFMSWFRSRSSGV
ncbi:MAG: M4 family metallopeptidase [Anaerolineae bacterium]|nr:M4 family metallopeptidase [Anaerolineae bacterium]